MISEATRLRPVQPADLVELVDLCAEHAAYEGAGPLPAVPPARLADLLFGDAPRLRGLVAERDGELVGFATWTVQVSTWDAGLYVYLDCLFLRPVARGQGLGREILATVARAAQAEGCAQVQWQTPTDNVRAIGFYDHLGARPRSKVRYALAGDALAALAALPAHA